jgi:transposase-like protein
MQCPECKSNHINKNGHKKGRQNYICVNCGRQFIDCYENQRGYYEEVKRECLLSFGAWRKNLHLKGFQSTLL